MTRPTIAGVARTRGRVGEQYWRRVFDPELLVDEGVIDPEDRALLWYAESAKSIFRDIVYWYEASGCRFLLPVMQCHSR